jgi:hypothetical protein
MEQDLRTLKPIAQVGMAMTGTTHREPYARNEMAMFKIKKHANSNRPALTRVNRRSHSQVSHPAKAQPSLQPTPATSCRKGLRHHVASQNLGMPSFFGYFRAKHSGLKQP